MKNRQSHSFYSRLNGLLFLVIIGLLPNQVEAQEMDFGKRITGDSIFIDVRNYLLIDAELFFEIKADYLNTVRAEKYTLVGAQDTVSGVLRLPLTLVPDSAVVLTDYVTLKAVMGNPNSTHTPYRYLPPFAKGKKVKVIQGFGGSFSHDTEKSLYAVDFELAVGDTVYAARPGLVIRVREDFTERGGRDMIDKANLINVLHEDGTIAAYVHLDHKGAFVEVGQTVERGQPIGISGFTGFTTTPHLHFVVRKARNIAVPIRFEGFNRKRIRSGQTISRK